MFRLHRSGRSVTSIERSWSDKRPGSSPGGCGVPPRSATRGWDLNPITTVVVVGKGFPTFILDERMGGGCGPRLRVLLAQPGEVAAPHSTFFTFPVRGFGKGVEWCIN